MLAFSRYLTNKKIIKSESVNEIRNTRRFLIKIYKHYPKSLSTLRLNVVAFVLWLLFYLNFNWNKFNYSNWSECILSVELNVRLCIIQLGLSDHISKQIPLCFFLWWWWQTHKDLAKVYVLTDLTPKESQLEQVTVQFLLLLFILMNFMSGFVSNRGRTN